MQCAWVHVRECESVCAFSLTVHPRCDIAGSCWFFWLCFLAHITGVCVCVYLLINTSRYMRQDVVAMVQGPPTPCSRSMCACVCGQSPYAWQTMQSVSISADFSHTFLQNLVKFYAKMKVFNGRWAHARQPWKHKDGLIRSLFTKQQVKGHVPLWVCFCALIVCPHVSELKVDSESRPATMATPDAFAMPSLSVMKHSKKKKKNREHKCVINNSEPKPAVPCVGFSHTLSARWAEFAASRPLWLHLLVSHK